MALMIKSSKFSSIIVPIISKIYKIMCKNLDKTLGKKRTKFYYGRLEDGINKRIIEDGIKYGISIGRRQPMHKMHLECIKEISECGLFPVIIIGSANRGNNFLYNPIENPLNEKQQRIQISNALNNANINDFKILALPDMGDIECWVASVHNLLKENSINPNKSVCHYRSKEDKIVKHNSNLVKPMKSSNEALIRYGISVWESYNLNPEEMNFISASFFRQIDLFDHKNIDLMEKYLVDPYFIRQISISARNNNPNKDLLKNIPITMLDLSLDSLSIEKSITSADIIGKEPVESIDCLYNLINKTTLE